MTFLKKIKTSFVYELFINYIFYHLYHFFWLYILNFKARILYILWGKKNEYFDLNQNDKLLIKEDINFKNLALKIKKETLPKIPELKKKIMSKEYREEMLNKNSAFGENPYAIELYDELSDELKTEIVNFAASKKMITTAASYMGIFPMITRVQVSLNIPRENSNLRSAMLWHKDLFGFKNLDFFMAVTDINEESGPFFCLEEKIKAGVFKNFKYKQDNKIGERGKVSLEEFDKVFKNKKIIDLIGSSGTAMLLDTFSTFHRGGFCKSQDRLVLRICYQSQDVVYDSYKKSHEYFLYDKSIKKVNIKDKFLKYLFFNNPPIIMKSLSKVLLRFYSLVEFKFK